MAPKLLKHLWSSPEVRSVLKTEALRFLRIAVVSLIAVALFRYWRGEPILDGLAGTALALLGFALAWLVSAVRTTRAVLREHGFLER